jgi:predicted trehalose synthase
MKIPILTALAVLALAGVAFAGPPPIPIASDFEGGTSTPTAYEQTHPSHDDADLLRSVQRASSQVQLACATDRATYCADAKTAFRAGRCLERHHREIHVACAVALSQATLAWSNPR